MRYGHGPDRAGRRRAAAVVPVRPETPALVKAHSGWRVAQEQRQGRREVEEVAVHDATRAGATVPHSGHVSGVARKS
jgi:hypothetical protein